MLQKLFAPVVQRNKSGALRILAGRSACYNQPMKRACSICGNLRQEREFNWRSKSREIRMKYCRYCQHEFSRKHYQVNKSRYLERNERRRLKHVELIRKAKSLPCAD